jgi:hypothetical protein
MIIALFMLFLTGLAHAGAPTPCTWITQIGNTYLARWCNPVNMAECQEAEITQGQYQALSEKGSPATPGSIPNDWVFTQAQGIPRFNTPTGDPRVGDFYTLPTDIIFQLPTELGSTVPGPIYDLPIPPYSASGSPSSPTISPDPPGMTCINGVFTITDFSQLPQ